MALISPKNYTDDGSAIVLLLDTNPYLWSSSPSLNFSLFLSHVLSFVKSILMLNQLNQVVIIATSHYCCDYIYDSSVSESNLGFCEQVIKNLDKFLDKDQNLSSEVYAVDSSLLSGSLSMALSYIQRVLRSGHLHPQPRILCLHGSPDGPEQYVSVMNAIFSAQRSMIPIDSCVVGAQHSAFLQQASYITGGIYLKPQQQDGLFQYLSTVFATDLHSRNFIQLPKPIGVDFRASCFCHKNTIDMGFICSVCLSIFCTNQKECSSCHSCGSVYGHAKVDTVAKRPEFRDIGLRSSKKT